MLYTFLPDVFSISCIYIYINLSGYGLAKVIVHKLTFRKTCRNVQAVTDPGFLKGGVVWYGNGMVTLFKHGISFRYTFIEKTNFLTSLKTKIKEIKLIKMKRKHLLFKEAVCKNRISLVKLFINQNLCLLIFP